MKRLLTVIIMIGLFLFARPLKAVNVDIYQFMGAGNADVKVSQSTMEESNISKAAAYPVRWTLHEDDRLDPDIDPGSMWYSENYFRALPGTVTVDGNKYVDYGRYTWRFLDKYDRNYVECDFSVSNPKSYAPWYDRLTIACYYTPGQTQRFDNNHDNITLACHKSFAVLQTVGYNGGPYIRAHSCEEDWKTTHSPNLIKVEPGKTYWVNLHIDGPEGKCKVAVFDPDDRWAQVGETAIAESVPGTKAKSIIRFGRRDGHSDNNSFKEETSSYFSHIMIDYTEGKFPLLPDINDTSPSTPVDTRILNVK